MSPPRSLLGLVLGIFCLFSSARLDALDAPTSFTLDLPFAANEATPAWLGHPEVPSGTFSALNLPIIPPDETSSLLVTFFFQETPGGFLRIAWQGPSSAQTLSSNFYEGIYMSNQRSLLISPETLQGGGELMLQTGDATLGVQRIEFKWLEVHRDLATSDIQDTLVTPSPGKTVPALTLDGQPQQADTAAWEGQIVNVPITEAPERIEQGVEFSVQLDESPVMGRLVLKENGLPWGSRFVVWINHQRAGTITPAVPDGTDGGFLPGSPKVYEGWREGSFFLPASLLSAGPNTFQFSVEGDGPGGSTGTGTDETLPLSVKDVHLQLNYLSAASENTDENSTTPSTTVQAPNIQAPSLSLELPTPESADTPPPAFSTNTP